MNMSPIKAWRHILMLIALTALVIIIGLIVYAIPSRWDEQAQGESLAIESYKADLKAQWNKDGEQ